MISSVLKAAFAMVPKPAILAVFAILVAAYTALGGVQYLTGTLDGRSPASPLGVLGSMAGFAVNAWLGVSALAVALAQSAGHPQPLRVFLVQGPHFARAAGVYVVVNSPLILNSLVFAFAGGAGVTGSRFTALVSLPLTGLGFFFLIVWSQAVPLLLDGKAAFTDSLRQSSRLTGGRRWEIFGLLITMGFVALAVAAVVGAAYWSIHHYWMPSWPSTEDATIWLAVPVVGTLQACVEAALYRELTGTPARASLQPILGD